jgi:predicted transcriptional regulator
MTIMTIRIPNDVKEALDKALEGEDKDAVTAQIIRDGLAVRAAQAPGMGS